MFLKNVAIVTTLFNVAHKSKILRSSYISEFVRGTFRLQVPSQITFVNFDQVMFSNFCLFSVSLLRRFLFKESLVSPNDWNQEILDRPRIHGMVRARRTFVGHFLISRRPSQRR